MTSQHIGRRLTIVYVRPTRSALTNLCLLCLSIFILLVGAFIPLWILPNSFSGLAAGAFCIQFGVQGAWGVVRVPLPVS